MTPFSAPNDSDAPSAQDLGCFSARQAVGAPFRAGTLTLLGAKPLRSTFRAGFGVFFCSAGGCHPVPRRKRYLFLPRAASEHLPRRIWSVFLLGRRLVSRSAQEMMPISAPNASGAPSAQGFAPFSRLISGRNPFQ